MTHALYKNFWKHLKIAIVLLKYLLQNILLEAKALFGTININPEVFKLKCKKKNKCFLASIFSISTLPRDTARKPLVAKVIKLERKKKKFLPRKSILFQKWLKLAKAG